MKKQLRLVITAIVSAIASFLLARACPVAAWVLVPLSLAGSLVIASYCRDWRIALGGFLTIATGTIIPSLWFFWGMMGTRAIPLWLLMIAWQVVPAVVTSWFIQRDERWEWALPFIWTVGLLLRGELNPLRFEMASPIDAMVGSSSSLLHAGGFTYLLLTLLFLVSVNQIVKHPDKECPPHDRHCFSVLAGSWGMLVAGVLLILIAATPPPTVKPGPYVVGLQGTNLEPILCPDGKTFRCQPVKNLVKALDYGLAKYPEAEVMVLPEYSVEGYPPREILDWAYVNQRWVILGGRHGEYNAAFIVSPNTHTSWQAKVQPLPGFPDGKPAEIQSVWPSPWGPIGICICYDLTLERVVSRLADLGATGIICPAMDLYPWGPQEHNAIAPFAQIRASELGFPVGRFASSGTSLLVDADGKIVAEAKYPASSLEAIGGRMMLATPRFTVERWLLSWLPAPLVHNPL